MTVEGFLWQIWKFKFQPLQRKAKFVLAGDNLNTGFRAVLHTWVDVCLCVCKCALSWALTCMLIQWSLSYFLSMNSIHSQHLTQCICRQVSLRSHEPVRVFRELSGSPASCTHTSRHLQIYFSSPSSLFKCLTFSMNLQNFLWLQSKEGFLQDSWQNLKLHNWIVSRRCCCY